MKNDTKVTIPNATYHINYRQKMKKKILHPLNIRLSLVEISGESRFFFSQD